MARRRRCNPVPEAAASVAVAEEEELGDRCVSSELRVSSSWAAVGYCAGARRSNASRRDS